MRRVLIVVALVGALLMAPATAAFAPPIRGGGLAPHHTDQVKKPDPKRY